MTIDLSGTSVPPDQIVISNADGAEAIRVSIERIDEVEGSDVIHRQTAERIERWFASDQVREMYLFPDREGGQEDTR